MGAAGVIAATGNVAPELVVELCASFQANDTQRACRGQDKLSRLRKALHLGTFPSVLKGAMDLIGEPVSAPRGPVTPLRDA